MGSRIMNSEAPPPPPNTPIHPPLIVPSTSEVVPPHPTEPLDHLDHQEPESKKYPHVHVSHLDRTVFVQNLSQHPSCDAMIESLKTSTRAWINSSHSGDKRRERMWMSFKEWKQLWTTFKKIDKRRFERQLGEASKKLLTLPPKKR